MKDAMVAIEDKRFGNITVLTGGERWELPAICCLQEAALAALPLHNS